MTADAGELELPGEPIPVAVLTGFLGSGKTTLLNHLLAHPDMGETAVIVNEFGEIGLDHLLIESAGEDTVLLNSGCLCCTVRGDLIETMRRLFKRRARREVPAFTRLAVETTGLADPAPILHTLMSDPLLVNWFRLDAVIATVDAAAGRATLDAHGESVKQAAVADRLLLTKTDLVGGRGARGAASGAQPGGHGDRGAPRRGRTRGAVRRRALRPGDQEPECAALASGRSLR